MASTQELIFVTGNKNKLTEASEILKNYKVISQEIDLAEIQSDNVEEIVINKAKEAYKIICKPLFVDDVSFEINALNGFPGPLVKFLLAKIGPAGIADLIAHQEDKSAFAVATIGYYDGQQVHVFQGRVKGSIVMPRGEGWGFDPIFQPEGATQTWGEMGMIEKNKDSHRRRALDSFESFLGVNK